MVVGFTTKKTKLSSFVFTINKLYW